MTEENTEDNIVVEEVVVTKPRRERSQAQKEQFEKARARAYELRGEKQTEKRKEITATRALIQAYTEGKLERKVREAEPEEVQADPPPPARAPDPVPAPAPAPKKKVTRRRIMVVEQTSSDESESETEIILPPKKKRPKPPMEEEPDDGLGKYMDRMFGL